MNGLAWVGIFLALSTALPTRKWQRGYIWRVMKKLPPFRFMKSCWTRHWLLIISLWWFSTYTFFHRQNTQNMVFWLPICILYLDDYLNGDDNDLWKKLKQVGNKIKWKMKLPAPVPARVKGV